MFFSHKDAAIADNSKSVLKGVVQAFTRCGTTMILVVGHTDRAGSADKNQELSEDRARAVMEYLVAQGIPSARVTLSGRGETQPRVPTADEVRLSENERVEIVFDSRSGM